LKISEGVLELSEEAFQFVGARFREEFQNYEIFGETLVEDVKISWYEYMTF